MDLNDLLRKKNINPQHVFVMRHRPPQPKLRMALPLLAAERPEVFNAYQQTQGEKAEKAMLRAKYIASFIGHQPKKALFVGIYSVGATKPLTLEQYWRVPAHREMNKLYGLQGGPEEGRGTCLWFDLAITDFYSSWKGKLVVEWPPPEISWWRWAHQNSIPVAAVFEDDALVPTMPDWDAIDLGCDDLATLPQRWREALSHWRGIYFIFDQSDGKGYVGSAYGAANLFGRWSNYAVSGHGGNKLLRERDRSNFRFTILQRVSPDLDADTVIQLENSWKERLHTRAPQGLNDN